MHRIRYSRPGRQRLIASRKLLIVYQIPEWFVLVSTIFKKTIKNNLPASIGASLFFGVGFRKARFEDLCR